jgi:uncharacterized protein YndB with AHSA1/START domain
MSEPTVIHDTFTLERTYAASVARVFAFLSERERKQTWYAAAEGRDVASFEMDFRDGGVERLAIRMGQDTPFPGTIVENASRYEDIVPGRRVVTSGSMILGGRRISSHLVTLELLDDGETTTVRLTHQAAFYEGADGPEMRKGGWEVLLTSLGRAVEA